MTENTSRLSTALADRYRIESRLGEGGMATVYLAEDLKHHRKVAVKVLRPELAAVLGADRFVQEIETTANLQHPHILPLFDSGEADSFLYYVMPFIDGETLRDKLDRESQLGIDEAVRIAREIADALDYAHRQGVIHRDIKPENILLHDGRPMVADFGIALALSAAAGGRMTETGLSLGTPHYMSPEQATAEKDLTNRADIYSLGSMLYEMLTGEPPHMGNSAQAIIMKIVTEDVQPVTRLRKSVPPNVEAAVATALEKLPADRFDTAAHFAEALAEPGFAAPASGTASSSFVAPGSKKWQSLAATFAGLSVLLFVLLVWQWSSPQHGSDGVIRMSVRVRTPDVTTSSYGVAFTLAPDGGAMIRTAEESGAARELFLRRWDRLGHEPLRGLEDAFSPVFSPDGRSVAYLNGTVDLMVYSLVNGTRALVLDSGLTDVAVWGGGIDWGPDGFLYASGLDGLIRLSPTGGDVEQLTRLDTLRQEKAHAWVDVLPGGRGALLTIIHLTAGDFESHVVAVADFATGAVTEIFQGVFARYVPSGHVVIVLADGSMVAAPFDPAKMTMGQTVALPDSVKIGATGAAQLAVSISGSMAYEPKSGGAQRQRLVWVDRLGREETALSDRVEEMTNPTISPDGARVAVSIFDSEGWHIWVLPLNGDPRVRLTYRGANNFPGTWTPNGEHVTYVSDQHGAQRSFMTLADGSGEEVRLLTGDPRPVFDNLWSPDGEWLLFRTDNQFPGNGDIIAIRPGIDTVARVLVASPEEDLSPALSPDGVWLAYVSSRTGRREVYIKKFLDEDDRELRVSRNGGTEPTWSQGGNELFYRSAADSLMAVEVLPDWRLGRHGALFSTTPYQRAELSRSYDVESGGQRFLMLRDADQEGEIVVVFNWTQELRELFRE